MALEVTLEPDLPCWASIASTDEQVRFLGDTFNGWRSRTRGELGLPRAGRLFGTGHQPAFWHPGILAKDIALATLCENDASSSWFHLIVDHDIHDPGIIRVPVNESHEKSDLQVATVRIVHVDPDIPIGEQPARRPSQLPQQLSGRMSSTVRCGVEAMVRVLDQFRDAPTLADQIARGGSMLAQQWTGPRTILFARDLLSTTIGRVLIEHLRDDPYRAVHAYNRAIRSDPGAGVAPLDMRGTTIEVPLWRIDESHRRRPVFAVDLLDDSIGIDQFRPRALLMTALIRLAIADLFVHGRGGYRYDRLTERWIASWLGVRLAPMTMATADAHLPISTVDAPGDVEAMRHTLRHALHDPVAAVDASEAPSDAKRAWLEAIHALPRKSLERREAFREMHAWIDAEQSRHEAAIAARRQSLKQAKLARRARAIAQRRDWAFSLYPEATLEALRREMESRLEGGKAHASCS